MPSFFVYLYFLITTSIITTFAYALPAKLPSMGEPFVLADPNEHRWGAYNANGRLIREGMASLGADWCADMGQECHTRTGMFRVRSLGGPECVSPSFPIPKGGSPMPYCMYFNDLQALHGSYHVTDGNISHGCIRLHVNDAKWLRFNFVKRGTLVIVRPYY